MMLFNHRIHGTNGRHGCSLLTRRSCESWDLDAPSSEARQGLYSRLPGAGRNPVFSLPKPSFVYFALFAFFVFSLFAPLSAQTKYKVKDKTLDEVSGIAVSRNFPGLYYVHNDSGGKAELYVMNKKGKKVAVIRPEGISNRDWEDIAIASYSQPGYSTLYIGEIGDNKAQYKNICLYRFREPIFDLHPPKYFGRRQIYQSSSNFTYGFVGYRGDYKATAKLGFNDRHLIVVDVADVDSLAIVFEDGAKDCETLMIDPLNGDVYLVSKREEKVGLYQIKAPLKTDSLNIARRILDLDFALAVGGDISPQRDKVIIKTYEKVLCWSVKPGQEIKDALSQPPTELPYEVEPQGEAICWSAKGDSYLTLSEKAKKTPLFLYEYLFHSGK